MTAGRCLRELVGGIALTTPLSLQSSATTLPLPIGPSVSYLGLRFTAQAAHADPGASHGVAFTPGLEAVIGS